MHRITAIGDAAARRTRIPGSRGERAKLAPVPLNSTDPAEIRSKFTIPGAPLHSGKVNYRSTAVDSTVRGNFLRITGGIDFSPGHDGITEI